MRLFVYKLWLYTTVCVVLISSSYYLMVNCIDKFSSFRIEPAQSIIFGHSHSECAFNDTLISNFKNVSASGESYFYTYHKMRKIIECNNSIDNILVEFTNNQIMDLMDEWTWGDYDNSFRSTYLPFVGGDDLLMLLRNNREVFISDLSKSFRHNMVNLVLMRLDYTKRLGGYMGLKGSHIETISINYGELTQKNAVRDTVLSSTNIQYLLKIVDLCRTHDVNLFLVRSPQHPLLYDRKNEAQFQQVLSNFFPGIVFLDFNDYPLSDNDFFDLEHLNEEGSRKFSLMFDKLYKKGSLYQRRNHESRDVDFPKSDR